MTDPDGVNLRTGPGTDFPSVAVIAKGTELSILGSVLNKDWLPVAYQGQRGFVNNQFVEVRSATSATSRATPAPVATPTPTPTPQQMRVTSPDGVNLRAGPGTDHRVQTVIPFNTRVTLGQRSPDGRWGQVTFNGQSGWIDTQYLEAAIDAPASGPASPTSIAEVYGAGRFIWPVSGRTITTNFGPSHVAIDIDQFPNGGNPVVATSAGKVTFAGGDACCSYGLHVKVEHLDGSETLYAHLSSVEVREGQEVTQGQTLGRSGNTGLSTGAHLHFELRINGAPTDPLAQLPVTPR